MEEMKEVLRKEDRVGRESKRKYEATLSDYEKLQRDYQILGEERDNLKQSNMTLDREKKKLQRKIAEMEVQKSVVHQQAEEHRVWITELEAQKSSLEVILKVANERKKYIAPLREHALLLRRKIYQVQVKLAEEAVWVKQVEDRLQEISIVATTFKERTQDIFEILQGQLTWLETNIEHPKNTPGKCPK